MVLNGKTTPRFQIKYRLHDQNIFSINFLNKKNYQKTKDQLSYFIFIQFEGPVTGHLNYNMELRSLLTLKVDYFQGLDLASSP